MEDFGEIVKVRIGLWVKNGLPVIPYSVHDIVENMNQVCYCVQ